MPQLILEFTVRAALIVGITAVVLRAVQVKRPRRRGTRCGQGLWL